MTSHVASVIRWSRRSRAPYYRGRPSKQSGTGWTEARSRGPARPKRTETLTLPRRGSRVRIPSSALSRNRLVKQQIGQHVPKAIAPLLSEVAPPHRPARFLLAWMIGRISREGWERSWNTSCVADSAVASWVMRPPVLGFSSNVGNSLDDTRSRSQLPRSINTAMATRSTSRNSGAVPVLFERITPWHKAHP